MHSGVSTFPRSLLAITGNGEKYCTCVQRVYTQLVLDEYLCSRYLSLCPLLICGHELVSSCCPPCALPKISQIPAGWVLKVCKVYWCNRGALYCRYHIHVTFGDILISEVHTCDLHHLLQFSPLFTATVSTLCVDAEGTVVCRVLHIRRVPAARVPT